MPFRNPFGATDAAGSRLSLREGPHGGAFVALGEGGNFPRQMVLRPEDVRRLRDWCDRALEGAAPDARMGEAPRTVFEPEGGLVAEPGPNRRFGDQAGTPGDKRAGTLDAQA